MAKKKKQVPKLSGQSLDITQEHIENLKSVFPQAVKDGEIDFDALKLALGSENGREVQERVGVRRVEL